ncbi:MAG: transporter substrate-binding domain-containing protein [Campylobacterota bacterium]|nr:transporter substrate-binding domain-containing protein [Campylobacterota bacterium]
MIKKLFLISFLFITPLLSQIPIAIYTANDYRPYSYVEHGIIKGIHVDILKSIFSKMRDYRLVLKAINWGDGLKKIEKSEILILSDAFYRPKKRPYIIDYSDAFAFQLPAIYCNKKIDIADVNNINWNQEFRGTKIVKQKGGSVTSSKYFYEAIEQGVIEIIEHDRNNQNLQDLINKKVDCYINEDLSIQGEVMQKRREYRDQNRSTQELDVIRKVAILSKEGIHLAFSKKYFAKRRDLLRQINLAIKVMNNSDEIQDIVENYMIDFLTKDLRHKSIDASIFPLGSFISDTMDNYGLLAEIITSAFADRNITVNYHFSSKNEAYLYNKWGKSCMSFPWNKELDSWLYYELSDPIMTADISFFYDRNNLSDGIDYNDLYDLKKYTIGGIKGAFYEDFFSGMSFDYSSFDNSKSALIALTLKQIDILPMNRHLFFDAVKLYMPYKENEFAYDAKPMTKKANYILFSKKCKNISFFRTEFNKGFTNIQKNGIFDKILDKYTTTKDEKDEFDKIFRNLKQIEQEEALSVFDSNETKHVDLNESNIDITDSNITIDEANITKIINEGEKKK